MKNHRTIDKTLMNFFYSGVKTRPPLVMKWEAPYEARSVT